MLLVFRDMRPMNQKKFYSLVMICLISTNLCAEVIDIPAGQFVVEEIDLPEEHMTWTIENLYDTDPDFAPAIAIQFYSGNGEIIYSIGMFKTDGDQNFSSYISVGSPQNSVKQSAVITNLSLKIGYEFGYSFSDENRVNLVISGKEISSGIEVLPVAAQLMVSGMEVTIEKH